MQQIRQGDVFLKLTKRKPSLRALHVLDAGRVILAYGEQTGHAHEVVTAIGTVLADDTVPAQQLFEESDGTRLLVVRGPATLRHEEHAPIAIPPGVYEVVRQREYAPDAIRNVAD